MNALNILFKMRVSITRRSRCRRRRRIRFMPAGERIITEHNAMSIKRTPSRCRFILNIALRDHDEKVKRTGNETMRGERERKGNKDGETRRKRERAWHYHRPRHRRIQAVVDLAEHFNDSSLPRAFTALAASRLGYPSIRMCFETTLKQASITVPTNIRLCLPLFWSTRCRFPFPLIRHFLPSTLHFSHHLLHSHFHSRSFPAPTH